MRIAAFAVLSHTQGPQSLRTVRYRIRVHGSLDGLLAQILEDTPDGRHALYVRTDRCLSQMVAVAVAGVGGVVVVAVAAAEAAASGRP